MPAWILDRLQTADDDPVHNLVSHTVTPDEYLHMSCLGYFIWTIFSFVFVTLLKFSQ
jgi:hypothetical protein